MRRRQDAATVRAETAVPLPGPGSAPWIWPWWLERQLDPGSPAWLPADLAGHNRTGRNWTVVGIPEGVDRWWVDRCGLLAPASGGWALDWWVGCDDRWRLPSREASTRQRLVDDAPVVETVVRVPGGEMAARHWAVPDEDGDLVVIEIANNSATPVAVALALRPVGPTGPTVARRVAIVGSALTVDGTTVLRADVAPRQSVLSDAVGGDVAGTVLANATPAHHDTSVSCPSGWATAALVWPLAHRATLRFEVPGTPRMPTRSRNPSQTRIPMQRPGPDATARGWSARVTRRTRLDLPPGPLAAALAAQHRHLLLGLPGDGDRSRLESAQVVAALSTAGLREEAATHLDAWLDDPHGDGRLGQDDIDTAATLWALGVWARTGSDDGLLARARVTVARAVGRVVSASAPDDPVAATWSLAGVQAAVRVLALVGEGEAAATAHRLGCARAETLVASLLAGPASGVDPGAGPSGPSGRSGRAARSVAEGRSVADGRLGAEGVGAGRGTEAALLAVGLGVLAPHHPVARAARIAARRAVAGFPAGAVGDPGPRLGLRPALTLALAVSAALAGEYPAEAIGWVLSVASPTWTWPTVVAPRLGTGSHGSGHDPVVAAALWRFGRALLVADPPPDLLPAGDGTAGAGPSGRPPAGGSRAGDVVEGTAVAILPALPAEWVGVNFEVHGLPTAAGPLSYAVRWHGDRPALLWELDGPGADPELTAAGLDPAWRGRGRRGDALLDPVSSPLPDLGTGSGDGISLA